MTIDDTIAGVIDREGGYVNDPNDRGGATTYGITEAVARANGYTGSMRDMPRSVAERIYRQRYVVAPGFDRIWAIDALIGDELVDTGVNMGPATAAKFLQRALNALNREHRDFADVAIDGEAGPATRAALSAFLTKRGASGRTVLLALLNGLQAERYVALCEARPANEAFLYGWIANRVCA